MQRSPLIVIARPFGSAPHSLRSGTSQAKLCEAISSLLARRLPRHFVPRNDNNGEVPLNVISSGARNPYDVAHGRPPGIGTPTLNVMLNEAIHLVLWTGGCWMSCPCLITEPDI